MDEIMLTFMLVEAFCVCVFDSHFPFTLHLLLYSHALSPPTPPQGWVSLLLCLSPGVAYHLGEAARGAWVWFGAQWGMCTGRDVYMATLRASHTLTRRWNFHEVHFSLSKSRDVLGAVVGIVELQPGNPITHSSCLLCPHLF